MAQRDLIFREIGAYFYHFERLMYQLRGFIRCCEEKGKSPHKKLEDLTAKRLVGQLNKAYRTINQNDQKGRERLKQTVDFLKGFVDERNILAHGEILLPEEGDSDENIFFSHVEDVIEDNSKKRIGALFFYSTTLERLQKSYIQIAMLSHEFVCASANIRKGGSINKSLQLASPTTATYQLSRVNLRNQNP